MLLIKDFMGTYRKKLRGEAQYTSFVPTPLTALTIDVSGLEVWIKEAEDALRRLRESSSVWTADAVGDIIRKESEDSWMLSAERLFSPFGVLFPSSNCSYADQAEISHLAEATTYAVGALDELPLCGRLLKNIHYLMCRGDRYEKKYPGEFRSSPLWLGPEGCTLKNASYVPPADDDMVEAFSALEKFINEDSDMSPLVRAALIHYQFEAIHPFIDANGRVGRVLNTLFLLETRLLEKPVLRWSHILWKYCDRYYAELQRVHATGRYEPWIRFFLLSLREAAEGPDSSIIYQPMLRWE